MAVDMSRLDVPATHLERQIRALVARQQEQAAEQSATRPRAHTHTTPEEGTP